MITREETAQRIDSVIFWFGEYLTSRQDGWAHHIQVMGPDLAVAMRSHGLKPGAVLRIVQCAQPGKAASAYPDWPADEITLQGYVLNLRLPVSRGESTENEAKIEDAAADNTDPQGPWSKPDTPSRFASRFNCSLDTFNRLREAGKVRVKELTSKLIQIHVDDLPAE